MIIVFITTIYKAARIIVELRKSIDIAHNGNGGGQSDGSVQNVGVVLNFMWIVEFSRSLQR